MKLPQKGSRVFVEGYGSPLFIGASFTQQGSDSGDVGLKYEGVGLDDGYGRGIIWIPYEEFEENRVYPEQVADGEEIVESAQKAKDRLSGREGYKE